MSKYQIQGADLAGFEVAGYRQDDGKFYLESGVTLEEMPEELELLGNTYTLEDIRYYAKEEKGTFFNAFYV